MSVNRISQLSDLPPAWLALLFQHVACGPRGLANAAALGQSCKFLHNLSEGPAVTYSNIIVAAVISSPDHPAWQWLAKRVGRVAGLNMELRFEDDEGTQTGDQLSGWIQPLQTLSGIPGVQLRVEWVGSIARVDHPCMSQWLRQHGHLISHLTMEVEISNARLKLRDFSQAAAACRSIDLTIKHLSDHFEVLDLSDHAAVAGSLHHLTCQPIEWEDGSLRGTSTLKLMSQLTALNCNRDDLGREDPWGILAMLTSLQRLHLQVGASGDPSPLSALSGLTYLSLESLKPEVDDLTPFTFSSLQSLSTLQQLEELHLGEHACAFTSLHGLLQISSMSRCQV
jgi:hypothetical protein